MAAGVTWRIYYDDESTFSSAEGTPNDAPAYGVICVVQPDEEAGRAVMNRWDYYVYRQGQWYGHHLDGLLFELLHHADEVESVKAGRSVDTGLYHSLLTAAAKDEDFPPKSAKRAGESGGERIY